MELFDNHWCGGTVDKRSLGSVFLRLAKAGLIVPTNEYRESTRPSDHGVHRVWRLASI